MYYNQQPQNFWEGLLTGLAQGIQQRQQDKGLWDAYTSLKKQEANSAIQPYQNTADAAHQIAQRANVVNDANKMATANMGLLSNPDYLRSLGMTDDEIGTAPPQMSNTQKNFINATNAAISTTSKYAKAASDVSMEANQALEDARIRYSPEVFDKLAPMIGRVPADKLIMIADDMENKRIEREEKSNAARIMKQAFHPSTSEADRIALLASNQYTMPIAEKLAGRQPQQPMHVAPGSYVQQGDKWVQVGQPTQSSTQVKLSNGHIGQLMPDGTVRDTGVSFYVAPKTDGNPKLGAAEKWAQNYELNQLYKDDATISEYEANIDPTTGGWRSDSTLTDTQKLALDKEAQAASGRREQYRRVSSGGAYNSPQVQSNSSGMSPAMQAFAQELNDVIQTKGADFARQRINANRETLKQRGIDPDIALSWIPS